MVDVLAAVGVLDDHVGARQRGVDVAASRAPGDVAVPLVVHRGRAVGAAPPRLSNTPGSVFVLDLDQVRRLGRGSGVAAATIATGSPS